MTELPDPAAIRERATALATIRDLVGARGWIDSADGMAPHLREERGNYVGVAAAVVKPGSVEEMAGSCACATVPACRWCPRAATPACRGLDPV